MKTPLNRLTDEELAELEHVCKSWKTRRAGDSFAYDSDVVFGGLASLLAEVRELRGFTEDVYRVIDCEDCNLGIVYYQDGTSDPCLICGGLEGVVSP